jgi:SAM-dependent methyltransferase
MLDQNIKYFKERVEEYNVSYLRDDEEYLIERFFRPAGKILVLGCGAGRTLLPLFEKGFHVAAIDIVPEMVEASMKKANGCPIEIKVMDATRLDYASESFDYVFFPFHGMDCIYPDIYLCVKESARVLKPDGVFIFNSHNRWFLKSIKKIFKGRYADYHGAYLRRSTPLEYFRLKKYFESVKIKYRISMQKKEKSNWKDRLYQLVPILSISIYFICKNPKK